MDRKEFISATIWLGILGYAGWRGYQWATRGTLEEGVITDKPHQDKGIAEIRFHEPGGPMGGMLERYEIPEKFYLNVEGECIGITGRRWNEARKIEVTKEQYSHYQIGDKYKRIECEGIKPK